MPRDRFTAHGGEDRPPPSGRRPADGASPRTPGQDRLPPAGRRSGGAPKGTPGARGTDPPPPSGRTASGGGRAGAARSPGERPAPDRVRPTGADGVSGSGRRADEGRRADRGRLSGAGGVSDGARSSGERRADRAPSAPRAGQGTEGAPAGSGRRMPSPAGRVRRAPAGDGPAPRGSAATADRDGSRAAAAERAAVRRAAAPSPQRPRGGYVPAARPPRFTAGGNRPRGSARRGAARLPKQVRDAWDRPLTAYYVILGAGLLITVLGLVMVYSASMIQALRYGLPSTYYFRKQLMAVAIGSVLLYAAARMPIRLHRALAYPLLLGAVFLMCLVQVPGIGQTVNGNTNWLSIGGPFQLQPSEFGKLALVMWGADLLARKNEKKLLTQWKHLLVPLVPVAVLLLGLIMLGGDMGTTMVLTAVLFGLLWLAGAPTRLFTGVLAAAGVLAALFVLTSPNRMGRLHCIAATSPGANDQCWQAVHGIYALASGGWFGTGLGASVEKWGELPEPHTDFIFAVTGEELGLAGTLSVLALFAALGYAGIRVAGRTEDPFVRFAAGGVTTWITVQSVINVGAVLGLLPIAGVPLPLFSYGGSALLPTMYAVGLLISFARSEPAARAALAMREHNSLTGVMKRTMRRRTGRRPSGER